MMRQWTTAIVIFTLLWTGTLWHDVFGMDILPLVTQLFSSVQAASLAPDRKTKCVRQTDCTEFDTIACETIGSVDGAIEYGDEDGGHLVVAGSLGELPCSCPSHVHSPSCLIKVDTAGTKRTAVVLPALLFACISANEKPRSQAFTCAKDCSGLLKCEPLSIYLMNRVLLI